MFLPGHLNQVLASIPNFIFLLFALFEDEHPVRFETGMSDLVGECCIERESCPVLTFEMKNPLN